MWLCSDGRAGPVRAETGEVGLIDSVHFKIYVSIY